MNQKELIKTVREVFESNPSVTTLHVCTDGQCFVSEHDARQHERHLARKGVVAMTRESVMDQAAPPSPPPPPPAEPRTAAGLGEHMELTDEKGEAAKVAVADLVKRALERSGLSVEDWNELEDSDRHGAIVAELELLQNEAHEAAAAGATKTKKGK
ncbi:MAG TPA: hypothetical protein PKE21_13815 [Flavobacteriales bacterium]|nr:hypothetical protein [Flavobacteriales bacterium]HMR28554.1 hypothetical protein [Flavobacteriales bacterium]